MDNEFVGRGWGYPIGTDATGGVALVEGDREIEQAIQIVLSTSPGERPMRPEFGCRIREFVFAPADGTTAGLIAYEVRESLRRWEPRISVHDVDVSVDDDDRALMWIDLTYSIRDTNDPRNLVFPFYLIPDHD